MLKKMLRMVLDNQHMIMLALHELLERARPQGDHVIVKSPNMPNHVGLQREALKNLESFEAR